MSRWPQVMLGDLIVEAAYGTSVKCSDTANGIPVLRMGNVRSDGTLDLSDLKYAPLTDAERVRFGIQEGDILFNRTNSKELVGKTGFWDGRFPAAAASYFIRVRVDHDVVWPKWVWHFMNSAAMKDRLFATARGAIGQANINSKELKSFPLPLPSLEEQRRIVGLLDRAAEIRRRADAARARARAIIPSLFLDMFGDPATNPKAWPVEPLGRHISLVGGGTPSTTKPEFWGGNIPWVSPKDMKPPIISDSEDKITEAAMLSSPARLVSPNNVLVVVRGMILAHTVPIRINSVAVTLNQDMKALVPCGQITATFLRWMLQVAHSYLLGSVRESAHGTRKLETPVLVAFPAMLPPLPLQTAFAEHARRLEATAHALDTAAAKAEAMGAALSARVFDAAAAS